MLGKCSICGRRLRLKAFCLESGKDVCRKCCDNMHATCNYRLLCWSDMN